MNKFKPISYDAEMKLLTVVSNIADGTIEMYSAGEIWHDVFDALYSNNVSYPIGLYGRDGYE